MASNLFRRLPSLEELLKQSPLAPLAERLSPTVVAANARSFLDEISTEIRSATAEMRLPNVSELAERVAQRILSESVPPQGPAINATGVVLPALLGGAPLADAAKQALLAQTSEYAATDPTALDKEINDRLRTLTGAEAALAMHSPASAALTTISALTSGKTLVIARRHYIKFDDAYDLPMIAATAGARLVDVGAINRATVEDYRKAAAESTGAIYSVYAPRITPPTAGLEPALSEIAALSVPVIYELDAGALGPLGDYNLVAPNVREALAAGAAIVLVRGDGLIGGPSCGLVLGRKQLIDRIAAHPLAKTIRLDAPRAAALVATLRLYEDPALAKQQIPLMTLLDTPVENLKHRAERLAVQLAACPSIAEAIPAAHFATVFDGAPATLALPTWGVLLTPKGRAAGDLGTMLATGERPVTLRIRGDRLFIDLRTVFARQDFEIVQAVAGLKSPDA